MRKPGKEKAVQLLNLAYVAVAVRLRLLLDRSSADRGDSPVPTAFIVVGMVVIAVAVLAGLLQLAENYLDDAPEAVP
jgi:hypothetical protein